MTTSEQGKHRAAEPGVWFAITAKGDVVDAEIARDLYAALKAVEWGGYKRSWFYGAAPECPECGMPGPMGDIDGEHSDACQLAAALRKAEGVQP